MRVKIPLPWVLVIIGISFNIVSALITGSVISSNNEKIHHIDNQISNISIRIDNYWQTRQNIERKKEFILLLMQSGHTSPLNEEIYEYVVNFINDTIVFYQIKTSEKNEIKQITSLKTDAVVSVLDLVRNKLLSQIDDAYLEKISLEEKKQPLTDKNSLLMSVALFLQLFGLILVLAKDLKRK